MKKSRILALILALVMTVLSMASCFEPPHVHNYVEGVCSCGAEDPNYVPPNPEDPEEDLVCQLEYEAGTILRMATGYNYDDTGIVFVSKTVGEGITLADGKFYTTGDLKPTWAAIKDLLKINFESKWTGAGGAEKEFNVWKDKLNEVDMVSGSLKVLSEAGAAGKLVNIAEYLDDMPNFKAYLEANPIVRLSVTGDTDTGAIYFSPYFDGVNDIERMPLMRTDWVEKLLNGQGDFTAAASNNLAAKAYTPYMPTSGKVEIDVVKLNGTETEKVTKDYDAAGNIIAVMNAELDKGTVTGVEAVNMLRDYIDVAYNGYYGTNRANLFIGQNAAWDADELAALLRCVVANPQTLNGTDSVAGIFSREDGNNQRKVDMFRFAGTLFGVRGLESRQDYLYIGTDGMLHDARQEEATYKAIEKMNQLVKEGLVASSYLAPSTEATSSTMLENDAGFMHYDYNQTQTIYNETKLNLDAEGNKIDNGTEKYMAVMIPVARWYDGTDPNGVYMRFTESWRSVKTDGWAISLEGVGNNTNKLHAALALIDYAYSPKGQIMMSYGPDAFIKTDAEGNYVTFNFNGQEMPVIADATYEELWLLADGNYTNYARRYLGSTLSFVKSQAFEYQCTHAVGKEGAGKISNAISLGTIKHPELALTENAWYTSVPTTLPNTNAENEQINTFTELASAGKFSQSKGKSNVLIQLIIHGYGHETTFVDLATALETVRTTWKATNYLAIKERAWVRLLEYYESLTAQE